MTKKKAVKKPKKSPAAARKANRLRMSKVRTEERNIVIDWSRCDVNRRRKCEADSALFMPTYFPNIFFNPFVPDQLKIINSMLDCIKYRRLAAIADTRGGGKSSIGKCLIFVWGIVTGRVKLPVIVEANMDEAGVTLNDIKESFFMEPDEGDDFFGDDFPEVCQPIRALDPDSRRRISVNSIDLGVKWTKRGAILPKMFIGDDCPLPELRGKLSPASNAKIIPRATNKPIRGIVRAGRRPDMVFINDIETDESASSKIQTDAIKKVITGGIMGLRGQGKAVGVMFLCTCLTSRCLAAQFTDRDKFPEWRGQRYKFFRSWPTAKDMWEKYIYIYKRQSPEAANQYYLDNRDKMDAGAVVSNLHRYDDSPGPDGEQMEYSAIQSAYNQIIEMGMDAFMTEWQNEPIETANDSMIIRPDDIAEKVNKIPRGEVPSWATVITAAADVHDDKIFWCKVAWKPGGVGAVVDYGVERVYSPISGSVTQAEKQQQVDIAILEALQVLAADLSAKGRLDIALVDSGYKPEPVYNFCKSQGGIWHPAKGGTGSGGKYTSPKKSNRVRNIGPGFHQSLQVNERIYLTLLNPDKFKMLAQSGLRVKELDIAGSISLFGDDPMEHAAFAEQIANEIWNVEKMQYEGPGGKKPRNNHFLDCLSMATAAAAIKGISVMPTRQRQAPKPRRPVRVTGAGKIRMRY